MSAAGLVRCFLALDLDESVRRRLREVTDSLRRTSADVRWTRDDGRHVTLAFLGNVSEAKLVAIEEAVRGITRTHAAFTFRVVALGAFPNLRRPSTLWAGVTAAPIALLAQEIAGVLSQLGFVAEKRPFHPHVTLGRMRSQHGWKSAVEAFRAVGDTVFGDCKAAGVNAYRSDLRPDGAVYTKLWTAEMGEKHGG